MFEGTSMNPNWSSIFSLKAIKIHSKRCLWILIIYSPIKRLSLHSTFWFGVNKSIFGLPSTIYMWITANQNAPCPFLCVQYVSSRRNFGLRAGANENQKTRNKKQNGLAHLRFLVCVTPKQKNKTLLDSRIKFLAKHVWNSQSTIYLKSHGCVHGLQNEMSLINFSTMFC